MGASDVRLANEMLDDVIRRRRSCRAFGDEVPPQEVATHVLEAGMHAPYAALAVGGRPDFRRFFVFSRGGEALSRLRTIAGRHQQQMLARFEEEATRNPVLAAQLPVLRPRLGGGVIPVCPWFVVVAELNGYPPVANEALAHCLQNMWLKATALGLGMQLVSLVEAMAADEELAGLLGLKVGEYSLAGCALGYPAQPLGPSERPDTAAATTWLG